MLVRAGHILWWPNCPPLDGRVTGRHAVVIAIDSDIDGHALDPVIVIGITTDPTPDEDRIPLPNLQDNPFTTTGLSQPCFALPRWIVTAYRDELAECEQCGVLPEQVFTCLLEAVERRLDEHL